MDKPSKTYSKAVESGKRIQESSDVWNGRHSYYYLKYIKKLYKKFNCESILDYGCGKGTQWDNNGAAQKIFNLSKDNLWLFDPCVVGKDTLPNNNTSWDLIMLTQCINHIPNEDFEWLVNVLNLYNPKVVFIGNGGPGSNRKEFKKLYPNADARTVEWYHRALKDITCPVYYYWRNTTDPAAHADNKITTNI